MSELTYETFDSPVGELLALADRDAIVGLHMQEGERPREIQAAWRRDARPFEALRAQLGEYFAGERRRFDLVLAPAGTSFQRRVWSALAAVPYAQTVSYGELAKRIDRPGAARAVGMANARNPISIVIGCHRVIGGGGALTGYAGGIARKRFLLGLEAGVA
jgi:methylated-DNA-[protein]-cysteine S-methyltransferase